MTYYTIPTHISGDTWEGIESIGLSANNTPVNLSGAYVEMGVKYTIASPSVLTLTTDNSGILITEPVSSGIVSIPPVLVEIPPGDYKWYLKYVLPSGTTKTNWMGTWIISPNIPKEHY